MKDRTEISTREHLPRDRRRWALVTCLFAASLGPAWGWAELATAEKPHPREKTLLKRQWGVELRGVRLSAAGHMLEFRYRVLDAEKAKPLFERKTKPLLTHQASGATLTVPVPAKTGPLRNSDPPVKGRTYWMFFSNPGQLVKPGEVVSVVIGEFRAEGLVVE